MPERASLSILCSSVLFVFATTVVLVAWVWLNSAAVVAGLLVVSSSSFLGNFSQCTYHDSTRIPLQLPNDYLLWRFLLALMLFCFRVILHFSLRHILGYFFNAYTCGLFSFLRMCSRVPPSPAAFLL